MSRRVGLTTLLLAVGVALLAALPAGAQSSGAAGEVEVKRSEVADAEARLSRIQQEVGDSYAGYQSSLDALNSLNSDIDSKNADLMATQKQLVEAQGELEDQASRVYRSGNLGFVDLLVGTGSFSEFATRLELWVRVLNQQQAEVAEVGAVRDRLAAERGDLSSKRDERSAALERASQQRDSAVRTEAEAREYLDNLGGELRAAVQARLFAQQQARERQQEILTARRQAMADDMAEQMRQRSEAASRAAAERQAAAEKAAAAQKAAEEEAARQAELAAREEAREQARQEAAAAQRAAEQEAQRQSELAAERQAAAELARQQAAAEEQAAEDAAAAEDEAAAEDAAAAEQQYQEPQESYDQAAAQPEETAQAEPVSQETGAADQQYDEPATEEAPSDNAADSAADQQYDEGAATGDPGEASDGAPAGDSGEASGGADPSVSASSNPNYAWQPHVAQVANLVQDQFGVTPTSYAGHSPSGDLAIDFMVGTDTALGQQVADYLAANADSLGLSYIMWQDEFYSTFPNWNGPAYTWVPWGDGEHHDHVHVSFCSSGQSGTYC